MILGDPSELLHVSSVKIVRLLQIHIVRQQFVPDGCSAGKT